MQRDGPNYQLYEMAACGLSSGSRLAVPRSWPGSPPLRGNCPAALQLDLLAGLAPVGQERLEALVGQRMVKDLSQHAEGHRRHGCANFGCAQ